MDHHLDPYQRRRAVNRHLITNSCCMAIRNRILIQILFLHTVDTLQRWTITMQWPRRAVYRRENHREDQWATIKHLPIYIQQLQTHSICRIHCEINTLPMERLPALCQVWTMHCHHCHWSRSPIRLQQPCIMSIQSMHMVASIKHNTFHITLDSICTTKVPHHPAGTQLQRKVPFFYKQNNVQLLLPTF